MKRLVAQNRQALLDGLKRKVKDVFTGNKEKQRMESEWDEYNAQDDIWEGYRVNDIGDFSDIDDEVGDTYEDLGDEINIYNRDKGFMYVNDDLIWTEPNKSHTEAFKKYLKDNDIKNNLDDTNGRLTTKETMQISGSDHVGFGHYANGIAVIDSEMENCKVPEIVNRLKAQSDEDVDKIYYYDYMKNNLSRVASYESDEKNMTVEQLIERQDDVNWEDVLHCRRSDLTESECEKLLNNVENSEFWYAVTGCPTDNCPLTMEQIVEHQNDVDWNELIYSWDFRDDFSVELLNKITNKAFWQRVQNNNALLEWIDASNLIEHQDDVNWKKLLDPIYERFGINQMGMLFDFVTNDDFWYRCEYHQKYFNKAPVQTLIKYQHHVLWNEVLLHRYFSEKEMETLRANVSEELFWEYAGE